ncbi:MAG: ABC transporter ATP-binding protein [Pontibacterium sp.]
MSIKIDNISFSYGGNKLALNDVSLSANKGSFTGLLGPNGAGKSTLYALLTRLYKLQSGDITIGDLGIQKHPREVMRNLGVVFQQSTLDLDLSVRQNLDYHAALHGIGPKQAGQAIEEELARIDMLDRQNDKVRTLNGGHRRRLEIARALIHQPRVLLLDEATVGLDPQTRQSLNTHVRKLCQDKALTVLWATHLIDELQSNDPVYILHQGQVKASGLSRTICAEHQAPDLQTAFAKLTKKEATS